MTISLKERREWRSIQDEYRAFCKSERSKWESAGRGSDYERCWTLALDFTDLLAFGPRGTVDGLATVGSFRETADQSNRWSTFLALMDRPVQEWGLWFRVDNHLPFSDTHHSAVRAAYAQALLSHGQVHPCWDSRRWRGLLDGLNVLTEYRFFRTLGMPADSLLDEWLDLTMRGVLLFDWQVRSRNNLDLRRDGIFFTQAVPAVVPSRPALPPRPTSARGALWLRNAIWGEQGLLWRFHEAVAATRWISPGPKQVRVLQTFGRRVEVKRAEWWKVGGKAVLFLDDGHIRLQGCDAATLEKLCTWADEQLGACFTKAAPYEEEYLWCDPGDGESDPPAGHLWDPTTCTLGPATGTGSGRTPAPASADTAGKKRPVSSQKQKPQKPRKPNRPNKPKRPPTARRGKPGAGRKRT